MCIAQNRWTRWFQIFFIFTLIWGNDPIWRAYVSNGLKEPTSELWILASSEVILLDFYFLRKIIKGKEGTFVYFRENWLFFLMLLLLLLLLLLFSFFIVIVLAISWHNFLFVSISFIVSFTHQKQKKSDSWWLVFLLSHVRRGELLTGMSRKGI